MNSSPHCAGCPVPAGRPCLGATDPARFAMFCAWASDPAPHWRHLQAIVQRSALADPGAGQSGPPAPLAARPRGAAVERELVLAAGREDRTLPLPEPVDRPTAAEMLDLIRRMKACPHWTKATCGCSGNLCAAGKGRSGQVTHEDCFACLRAGGPHGHQP